MVVSREALLVIGLLSFAVRGGYRLTSYTGQLRFQFSQIQLVIKDVNVREGLSIQKKERLLSELLELRSTVQRSRLACDFGTRILKLKSKLLEWVFDNSEFNL